MMSAFRRLDNSRNWTSVEKPCASTHSPALLVALSCIIPKPDTEHGNECQRMATNLPTKISCNNPADHSCHMCSSYFHLHTTLCISVHLGSPCGCPKTTKSWHPTDLSVLVLWASSWGCHRAHLLGAGVGQQVPGTRSSRYFKNILKQYKI